MARLRINSGRSERSTVKAARRPKLVLKNDSELDHKPVPVAAPPPAAPGAAAAAREKPYLRPELPRHIFHVMAGKAAGRWWNAWSLGAPNPGNDYKRPKFYLGVIGGDEEAVRKGARETWPKHAGRILLEEIEGKPDLFDCVDVEKEMRLAAKEKRKPRVILK